MRSHQTGKLTVNFLKPDVFLRIHPFHCRGKVTFGIIYIANNSAQLFGTLRNNNQPRVFGCHFRRIPAEYINVIDTEILNNTDNFIHGGI
ncbi:Uncharacterised protein [Salmonella enterica subsp. enterica serovar Typhi]|nr:Uncharacterised protein [Salmonella enterica subsp. enterica serovar Typhi]CRB13874.1 Uncharacterised protein [Salmonella enterica subsp. enterica serovar Typhi]